MAPAPSEEADLELVRELLLVPNGLEGSRFSLEETQRGSTPDFRINRQRELVAYTEVKSPRDDAIDELLATAAPGEIVQLLRNDPVFNRIGRHVIKSARQFEAVNPEHALPNVLAFVNHDRGANYSDMREALTGMFFSASGETHPTMMHRAEGWIGDAKRKIDLFAWIDARDRRIVGYVDNEISGHQATVSQLFGLGNMRRIPQAVWLNARQARPPER